MDTRKSFLDGLRVAATCAVVLLHTITGVMDITDMSAYSRQNTVFLVAMDLITWCVPIFILISGYLFLNPQKELSFVKMCGKYCRRILLALFLFGVPFACLELLLQERTVGVGTLGRAFLMVCKGESWSHMWYLYLIILLYFFAPGWKWLLGRIPKASVYLILMFLFVGSSLFPFLNKLMGNYALPVLSDGWIYLFYYLGGFLFVSADAGMSAEAEGLRVAGGKNRCFGRYAALFGLMVIAIGMVCSRLVGDYQVRMAYNYPFTVIVALLLFYLAKTGLAEKAVVRSGARLTYLGTLCFAVYLVHPVFLNFFYKFLHITPLQYPIWISLPGMLVVVLVLSFGTAAVLRKIPILRKYVL